MSDFRDGGVILDGPFDPDAQATVTDYIDYTEYLPADIIRSLTLIRGLDERYLEAAQGVHDLTKTYGQLPDLPSEGRPDSRTLRKNISSQLDYAINARESAYAEACRLYDVVDRHFNRLDCINQKLNALPKPASREPTPPPQAALSSKRRSKKAEEATAPISRITLRLDSEGPKPSPAQKSRTRRSVISSHLAGLHPDSPIASTEHSDAEPEPKVSLSEPRSESAVTQPKKDKARRRSRTSGAGATGHGSVAGISTSNALALLQPPPEDAQPGSQDMPWLRLTDWEMTKLRKKMKKNAVWQPSEVMIHRELALRGRGWEAYRSKKAEADSTGTGFIDCDDIMNNYIPGKLTKRGEAPDDGEEAVYETKLSNRGMKLNEAKKLKRENQAREQAAAAAAAAEAEEAAKRLGQAGTTSFKPLFQNGANGPDTTPAGKSGRSSRKRKLDESPVPEPAAIASPADAESRSSLRSSAKRRKGKESPTPPEQPNGSAPSAPATSASASVSASAAPEVDEAEKPPAPAPASPTESKRSLPLAVPAPTIKETTAVTPPVTRPPSRRSAATSVEPTSAVPVPNRDLRRKSATPARKTPVPETSRAGSASAPVRRRKRPAPGPVSTGQDGGAAVSYGRRKAKPVKKRIGPREPGADEAAARDGIRIDEDGVLEEIDPNEPRYCLCGDVSFGTMICCENQDCDREWFHLNCVGLSEVPSRTAKWYCPECRVRFQKGMDGIVKNSSRR
ncbi:hypothetical protein FE257_008076 [Aspergillus nanangensis]|uniref:Chromatin modification-related protein n=1 Tax=Aspergillus nanangensis TaxID=2582783 RepID=A0AAD4CM78_ASPNN|nr:hypothetical protein FE257_008076 [Aspergillus nanangensis]